LGNRGLAGPLCLTGSPAAGEVPDELPAIVARIEGLVAKA
jgi:hypothetical protein